jgi:hypothetical protein
LAEPIPLAELELRIALLPPVSRGAHLHGPMIHAQRLAQLWRGGEMTVAEIGEASDDELNARRVILADSAEAEAIDAELRARTRSRRAAEDQAIPEHRWKCVQCGAHPSIRSERGGYLLTCVCGVEAWGSRASMLQMIPRESELASAPATVVMGEMTIDAVRDYLRKQPQSVKQAEIANRADHWGDDDVPLSQAFRLLDTKAVAGAILRVMLMSDHDYPNDLTNWPLPPFKHLLSELNEATWQALLDGELQIEAIRYERGKIGETPCVVSSIELARLSPDWKLSRLCRGDLDKFVEARVRRASIVPVEPPAETLIEPLVETPVETSTETPTEPPLETPTEPPKRYRPSWAELKEAMEEIDRGHPKDARPPPFKDIEKTLKTRYPGRRKARCAMR